MQNIEFCQKKGYYFEFCPELEDTPRNERIAVCADCFSEGDPFIIAKLAAGLIMTEFRYQLGPLEGEQGFTLY
ncbi:hypothetical protein A3J78_01465 [Candidatus Beckwithbacteria bacterium RBG_13_35_6]|uniref:Uncharacterized protein n=1 Tax=Candidatus Beckwithbacteria bacterium RBG_13_35_6 TaxID=1797456 RepID=A0A1F5DDV9_9BACT|nr:MAG: hypothetical protein A3J78_01465 [Candidatus Beckwithbacteria bacterium RBG_13_35_6]